MAADALGGLLAQAPQLLARVLVQLPAGDALRDARLDRAIGALLLAGTAAASALAPPVPGGAVPGTVVPMPAAIASIAVVTTSPVVAAVPLLAVRTDVASAAPPAAAVVRAASAVVASRALVLATPLLAALTALASGVAVPIAAVGPRGAVPPIAGSVASCAGGRTRPARRAVLVMPLTVTTPVVAAAVAPVVAVISHLDRPPLRLALCACPPRL